MKLLISTGGWIGIGVAIAAALTVIIWAIATYNRFVGLGQNCKDAFSGIDVYLKKRYDIIPNLVETVKGYAKHESETFTKVTEARAKAMSATTVSEKIEADREMTGILRSFNRVTESYPELKANTGFLDLQGQLRAIENELVNARKYYNACVREMNKKMKQFPALIIAKMMKLEEQDFFAVDNPEERQNVKVQF